MTPQGSGTWATGRRSSSRCSAPSGSSRSSRSTTVAPAPRRSPGPPGSPLATTYHLLRTCTHEGWLQRLDDGSYVLGHRIDVVRWPRGRLPAGSRMPGPALEWLRDELGGAVYLARYVDGEIVVAEIVDSARAPRIDLWVGRARRRARDRAGQVHPRPASPATERERLPVPPSAARPHPAHRRRPPPAAAARRPARSPWTTASTRSASAASLPR